MTAFRVIYIVLPTAGLLLFLLIIIVMRLLYKWRKEKSDSAGKLTPVIRPPSFKIPVSYRTVDAQTPATEVPKVPESQQVTNGRKIGVSYKHRSKFAEQDLELLSPKDDAEVDAFSSPESCEKRHKTADKSPVEKKYTAMREIKNKRLSLPVSIEKDTLSSTSSVASFSSSEMELDRQQRNSSAKGRQRRISVTVFQHLKTEGKKISQSEPTLFEEDRNMALTAALEAAEFRSYASDIETANDSANASDEDSKAKSENQGRGVRKRLAVRRWQEQPKSFKAGKVCFTTLYEPEQRNLEVTVLRAFDLGKRKDHNYVNPFVRLYLLPGKKQKQHTRVQRKTKEPFFNDKRVFYNLSEIELQSHRLKLKVYSREAVKKNELLGEAEVALGSLRTKEKETFSLDLHMTMNQEKTKIMISLLHDAAHSKLKVIIHKAKDLPKLSSIGLPDSYCRILFFREKECEKKETKIKRNSRNPCWDETHVLNVATDIANPLNMMSLVVTVISHSLMGRDEIVGHVIFSLDSNQSEAVDHWKTVEDSPHSLITRWHRLVQPEELERFAIQFH